MTMLGCGASPYQRKRRWFRGRWTCRSAGAQIKRSASGIRRATTTGLQHEPARVRGYVALEADGELEVGEIAGEEGVVGIEDHVGVVAQGERGRLAGGREAAMGEEVTHERERL